MRRMTLVSRETGPRLAGRKTKGGGIMQLRNTRQSSALGPVGWLQLPVALYLTIVMAVCLYGQTPPPGAPPGGRAGAGPGGQGPGRGRGGGGRGPVIAPIQETGFQQIFDGKSLSGWDG